MEPPISVSALPIWEVARKLACAASLLTALATLAVNADAADIDPNTLAMLQEQVQRTGWVRVLVTLERGAWRTTSDEQTLRLNGKAEQLYAELGDSALPTGRWNNGRGLIGFYTDTAGLAKLSSTSAAERFSTDLAGKSRGRERAPDGSFDAIDNALVASPTVEVDLVLATDEPSVHLDAGWQHPVRWPIRSQRGAGSPYGRAICAAHQRH